MKATINLFDESVDITIEAKSYADGGRTAIVAMCDEGLFGKITVNDPSVTLGKDEVLVKTWTENAWVRQLLDLLPGVFKDTGRRTQSGYALAEVWKFTPQA